MNTAPRLAPSLELVHRVNEASIAYTIARLRVLERLPGNPIGVTIRSFEGGAALAARDLPVPSFNGVLGLRAGQRNLIAPLTQWLHEHGAEIRFELAAGDHDPEVGLDLARLGLYQSGFHAALIGEPAASDTIASDVSTAPVVSATDMEDFLAAYVAGWGVPEAARQQFKANVRAWPEQPGWSLFVARVDGKPAASAILFIHKGVGYFADCAVDPAFRRRGLHAALLRRRWREAREAGVDCVCSGAAFLSTSHRNMERAGMRLLFLRAIWTRLDQPCGAPPDP
jgi:ribosomal protein S18 acetylase RimI-like enzyme